MGSDTDAPPTDEENEEKNTKTHPKDNWDKASIILKPVSGLLTAIAIVLLGYFTSNFLEKQKESETDVRLYTQLMSERERAEQSLRTTMFKEIFDRVLKSPTKSQPTVGDNKVIEIQVQPQIKGKENEDKGVEIRSQPPPNGGGKGNLDMEAELRTINTHVVGIDMISRNFHEFLDMKPLFLHVMWEIVVKRGEIKDQIGNTAYVKNCNVVGENWNEAEPCQELLWQQIELVHIARRIIKKQFNILMGNGQTASFKIPLKDVCQDKNMRTFRPADPPCEKKGFEDEKELSLAFGNCTRTAKFKISVKRAYPDWNMVLAKITWSVRNGEGCRDDSQFKTIETETKPFWVGSFDFPMIDNTYISADERYAVILDEIDRNEDLAVLKLVYFPASDAGLQEKTYYQQKLLERLINQSDLFRPTGQR